MRIQRIRNNHKGSTLLMVIICIAFIGILGSLILSVSMVNLQMKKVQNKNKNNFYSAETALEEIKTGLEELIATSIKLSYEEVLKNYSNYITKPDDIRNKEIHTLVLARFKEVFIKAIYKEDRILDYSELNYNDVASLFKKYLSLSEDRYVITINSLTEQYKVGEVVPYSLLFDEVKIIYKEQDYSTTITSDIRITLPNFTFSGGGATAPDGMKQPYEHYALVADGEIISENNNGVNHITGNVYSGTGITIKDTSLIQSHKVFINGDQISTNGDIKVLDTATLNIGSVDNNIRPILWADNIFTDTTGSYSTLSNITTDLNINAISLLKDDLTLDARNSKVKLTGAFIGYSGLHTAKGSSIIVNGSGSSLDLSELSSLVIAGRAHISIEDSYRDVNILTGESLAFKSNQRAYLIPGEYIYLNNGSTKVKALHNPITQKDLLSGTPSIEVTSTTDNSKVNYINYIKSDDQYEVVAKQTIEGGIGTTTTLRYYYLKFASGKLADLYFRDYMTKYPENIQVMDNFSLKEVKLPSSDKITSAGNVMYYEVNTPKSVKYIPGKSEEYNTDADLDIMIGDLDLNNIMNSVIDQYPMLQDKQMNDLINMYSNTTRILKVENNVLRDGISRVHNLYNSYIPKSTGFSYYSTLVDNRWTNTDPNTKSIVILTNNLNNGDVEIAPNSRFNGVLITSGNVTIGKDAIINGIIIAGGSETSNGDILVQENAKIYGRLIAKRNIRLKENCIIDCSVATSFDTTLTVEKFLEDIFKLDKQILWELFVNPEPTVHVISGSSASDLVNIDHLVTFENWRLNK